MRSGHLLVTIVIFLQVLFGARPAAGGLPASVLSLSARVKFERQLWESPDNQEVLLALAMMRGLSMLIGHEAACSNGGDELRRLTEFLGPELPVTDRKRLDALSLLLDHRYDSARDLIRVLLAEGENPVDLVLYALSFPHGTPHAIELLERATHLNGGASALFWIGWRFEAEGRRDLAIEWYTKSYQMAKDNVTAARLSLLALDAGDLLLAKRWAKKAGRESEVWWLTEIAALVDDGKIDDALRRYRERNPFPCGRIGAVAATRMASGVQSLGKEDDVVEYFKRALELDSSYLPAYRGLASVALQRGRDLFEMAPWLQGSLQRTPDIPEIVTLRELVAKSPGGRK